MCLAEIAEEIPEEFTRVYTSESPHVAMNYIRSGHNCLLIARVCPSIDSELRVQNNVIEELIVKRVDQISPVYIVHFHT